MQSTILHAIYVISQSTCFTHAWEYAGLICKHDSHYKVFFTYVKYNVCYYVGKNYSFLKKTWHQHNDYAKGLSLDQVDELRRYRKQNHTCSIPSTRKTWCICRGMQCLCCKSD